MESLTRAVIFLLVATAVYPTPLIKELAPGQEWPEKNSVRQPGSESQDNVTETYTTETIADVNPSESIVPKAIEDVKVDYTGAQLWKVEIKGLRDRTTILKLQRNKLIGTWGGKNGTIDILVKPEDMDTVKSILLKENVSYEVVIEDLQKRIDEENPPLDENEIELQNRRGHSMTWKQYHRLSDIYGFMDYLAKTYPSFVSVKTIGKSYENRDIKILRISNGNLSNKAIFIDGGIHAREWISPATVTYFIYQFVENFDGESEDIKNIDWYFLPVVNPDGYEYTHEKNRLWRKNRKPSSFSQYCIGTDLNRNFGFKWGGKGASRDPCSEIFRGRSAFSEPESKAVADFIRSSGSHFSAYLTYHSYGQYMLFPWGYDSLKPKDYALLTEVGQKMAQAVKNTGGYDYTVGVSSETLYPAAGGSDDWALSEGIKYSYTVELSDTGRYGFILPTSFIEPVAKAALAGLRVLAGQVHST